MYRSQLTFRLQSLDAFRGITIAGMVLVNVAALSPSMYPWFVHAYWNGYTLADCIFPCFLFIVGVAAAFSLSKYEQGQRRTQGLYWRLLRRVVILFVIGLLLNVFLSDGADSIKLTGVLQRISLAYLSTAAIALHLPRKVQWGLTALLLLGYWAAYVAFPIPEPVYIPGAVERNEMGKFGIMSLFGMLPTVAITLMGYFTGAWLHYETVVKQVRSSQQSMTLLMFGLSSVVIGLVWSLALPINKKLWTSSYALLSVGLALLLLAIFYELIDVRGIKPWSHPLQILGLNSLFLYIISELAIALLEKTRIGDGSNAPSSYLWLDEHLFLGWSNVTISGLIFALGMLLILWLLAYFLYRRRWIIAI